MTASTIADQSLALAGPAASRLVVDSRRLGWTTCLVQQQQDLVLADELVLPAVPDQHVVVLDAGLGKIESRGANGRQRGTYRPGIAAMTAPGRPTDIRWRAEDPLVTSHVFIPGDLMTDSAARLWPKPVDQLRLPDVLAVDDPVVVAVVTALVRAVQFDLGETYAETAIAFLAAHLVASTAGLAEPSAPRHEDARIATALAYVHDHLGQPLTVGELASLADLSTYHFVRVFRRATGRTPHQYITGARVERARSVLTGTDLTISEIAYALGFANPAHFAHTFRRQMGVSPSEYRMATRPGR